MPEKEAEISQQMCCARLRKGDRAVVKSVNPDSLYGVRLQEMGLTPGVEFEVVKVAPLGDPIEISLRGYRLCLRKAETEDVSIAVFE